MFALSPHALQPPFATRIPLLPRRAYIISKTCTLLMHTLLASLSQFLTFCSWDDWVPEDRLRKLTPENRELANNLRHEMLAAQRAARAQPAPAKKKAQGSVRGSEERQSSVTAAPRGQKRVRDNDLEKV